jgi:GT2 family glycosyltransferase
MSIPVIIVPILNQPELLDDMLASIDHPVDRVIVIDNGDVVRPHPGTENRNIMALGLIQTGHNLGVAASWNLGIKASVTAPWWLLVNHDITFGEGDLEALEATVEPRASACYKMSSLAAFAITPPAIAAAGWADENIHPAYDEDLDWERRMYLAGVVFPETRFTGTHVGSATIGHDQTLRHQNSKTHPANDRYYERKWGGTKQGGEKHETPFGKDGSLGDWTLDIGRLRDQAWKR